MVFSSRNTISEFSGKNDWTFVPEKQGISSVLELMEGGSLSCKEVSGDADFSLLRAFKSHQHP